MKAYVINNTGAPGVMKLQDIPEPITREGEVRIRVHAFGINRLEVDIRSGSYGPLAAPTVLGIEAVGEVIEDNSGAFFPGQRVATAMGGLGFDRTGSYAEQVVVRRDNVIPFGDVNLDWEELAALPEAFLTAWGALTPTLGLSEGQRLLIRGATSSVGQAAIVYAKYRGAKVIATTRRHSQCERLIELGADSVLVDTGTIAEQVRQQYPQGVDAVLEITGGETVRDSLQSVRAFGEVVVIGLLSGRVIEQLDLLSDLPNAVGLRFFSTQMLGTPELRLDKAPLAHIAQQRAMGAIPSIRAHSFDFDQIIQAHELMSSNQAVGKIVVRL
ncbi:Zinc-containing alcohol dehydrogenase superfamily [Xenorhabdus poinarii G6]|uniref:Zinc-containing alcohol dehydrogenase superfamily n=1 Tax=Xenorhabdus poinarii G6 TaxID=1354304 RepID=A0A068R2U4_9GAMM|nr:zinc-binding dehydrogenase [Xenorhabdus poinarii]CDG21597.1 Zinc-containing alcohol dehydrogenase superfamily [Xenorhabdus poinarii G6]